MSGKISFIHEYGKPTDTGHILLTDVLIDNTFRCREQEDDGTVEEYTEVFKEYNKKPSKEEEIALRAGGKVENAVYPFHPVWVWQDGDKYYLIAGFHRYMAAVKAGIEKIRVKEFHGTKDEAILFAMKDNRKNGLRMSYGDWKYCVGKALLLFPGKTAGVIAKELGCSRSYAHKIQKELSTCGQLPRVETRIGADNKERSVQRKIKQSIVSPVEEIDHEPMFDLPDNRRKATSKQDRQTSHDAPNVAAPVEVVIPIEPGEDIKPTTSSLEKEMDHVESYCRELIRDHRQRDDRSYIAHRVKELLKKMETEWHKFYPQR